MVTRMKVWENLKQLWKHSSMARVSTAVFVFPDVHLCYHNFMEIWNTFQQDPGMYDFGCYFDSHKIDHLNPGQLQCLTNLMLFSLFYSGQEFNPQNSEFLPVTQLISILSYCSYCNEPC